MRPDRRRLIGGGTAALAAAAGGPAALHASDGRVRPVTGRGWQEAVACVSAVGLDLWTRFLVDLCGWRVLRDGPVDGALLSAWGLEPGAGASERLLANPGDTRGWVRLVRLAGPEGAAVRPAARPWDPGGYFSIMTRTRDAAALWAGAQRIGLRAENEPQDFTFGGVRLRNVVLSGPDGIHVSAYERLDPLLAHWDSTSLLSRAFNLMTMTRDFEAERAFFQDGLGFGAWFIGTYEDSAPVATNFGLPVNLSVRVPRRSGILWEAPGEDGRIELMRFEGLDGVDHAPRARFGSRGIVSARMPVAGLDARVARLSGLGHRVVVAPAPVRIAPYGAVRLAWARSPNGCIVELFEPVTA